MGTNGLEPSTSRLSGVRSNHLSYAPIMILFVPFHPLVEMRRIELLTPCLQSRCSPSWATPPQVEAFLQVFFLIFQDPFRNLQNWTMIPVSLADWRCAFLWKAFLLRKEVIQPHLLIRLPCYDFTPVVNPTFGSVLLAVRLLTSGVTDSHGVTGGVYKARERIHRSMLICDY